MTRIIAGFAGSLRLAVPERGTRPTSDRVREAIFSALQARDALAGKSVVDLYAGSGALGLEAASRGASNVTLVERNAATAQVCRDNASRVMRNAPGGSPEIVVIAQSVARFLASSTATWDVAFLDPPYELPNEDLELDLVALVPRLALGAILVVERGSKSPEPTWSEGVEFNRRKVYGDTTLWWAGATGRAATRRSRPSR